MQKKTLDFEGEKETSQTNTRTISARPMILRKGARQEFLSKIATVPGSKNLMASLPEQRNGESRRLTCSGRNWVKNNDFLPGARSMEMREKSRKTLLGFSEKVIEANRNERRRGHTLKPIRGEPTIV